MKHPILIAALVEDRRRRCLCGTVTQPYGLCRECGAVAVWRRETERTRRHGAANWTRAGTLKAQIFARAGSLLQITSKGAES
jgi:hypothetical protein